MSTAKFDPLKVPAGEQVGPYEVIRLEAEGGYGFLYRVRRDGKTYALKIGRYDFGSQYPDDRERDEERLDREIAAMKTLHHPNIVRVLAFDRWPDLEGGYPYIVMEYVEGRRLDEWLAEAAPALARIALIYEKIALAVEHMHAHGIYHRDLKAQNVVVKADGEPIVLDFGLARPRYAQEVTRAGMIGTVTHYAPEYVRWCDSAASLTEPFVWQAATDLHAFGYMLYEALAGKSPFATDSRSRPSNDSELLLAIKKIVPRRASSWNPRIPAVLDDLVAQLLAKEPEQRPQKAGDVARALRQAREAAQASGDRAWSEPFDRPTATVSPDAHAPTPDVGGDAPDAAGPPVEARAEPVAGPGLAELIKEGGPLGSTAVVLPTAGRSPPFVDEEPHPGVAMRATVDPLANSLGALKAQVAASAPRARASPLALGGFAVAVTVLAILVLGRLRPPAKEGPKTLLSMTGSAIVAPGPPLPTPSPTSDRLVASPSEAAPTDAARGSVVEPLEQAAAPAAAGPSRPVDGPSVAVGERTDPAHAVVPRRAVFEPELAPIAMSRHLPRNGGVLQRSQPVQTLPAPKPDSPKARGVPYGSHIRARLLSNLDTRTIGSGPVEAILDVPHVVRGEVVIPVRTLVYGTATETAGRFTVRFTRLRLPDDTELAFEALALARDDGKPGLAASRRIERPPEQREGVASRIAKGTGNILLDTITGGTPGTVARNAGQAVLNQEASQPVSTGQWALLLDAGVVFDLWVDHAF